MVTGVVADAVNQVIEFAPGDIEPPPAFGTGVRLQYLDGIAKIGESFVLVLNMDNLLSESAQALAVDGAGAARRSAVAGVRLGRHARE